MEQVHGDEPARPGHIPGTGLSPDFTNTSFKRRDTRSKGETPGTSGLNDGDIIDLGDFDANDDDNDDDDEEEEEHEDGPSGPSVPDHLKPLDLSSIQFRQLYELVKGFFPSAVIEPPPSEEPLKVIEGLYGNVSGAKAEPCRFTRYYKFDEVKDQISDNLVKRYKGGADMFADSHPLTV